MKPWWESHVAPSRVTVPQMLEAVEAISYALAQGQPGDCDEEDWEAAWAACEAMRGTLEAVEE